MARDVFIDTAGLYALADRRDPARTAAQACVEKLVHTGRRFVLTDYIIDEACTLAKVRSGSHAALRLLEIVERSAGFRLEWIGSIRFEAAKTFFRQHADHDYSFTDCASFVIMTEFRMTDVLTTDRHFVEAGFNVLLPIT